MAEIEESEGSYRLSEDINLRDLPKSLFSLYNFGKALIDALLLSPEKLAEERERLKEVSIRQRMGSDIPDLRIYK